MGFNAHTFIIAPTDDNDAELETAFGNVKDLADVKPCDCAQGSTLATFGADEAQISNFAGPFAHFLLIGRGELPNRLGKA